MLRRLLIGFALIALAGCRMPSLVPDIARAPGPAARAVGALQGRIEGGYRAQATLAEIGDGATVSLIDPNTGTTLVTTISAPDGTFLLNFGSAFSPVDGQAYCLEAVKGVRGGNVQFNQAGADAVRLRTLVFFQSSPRGWKSLSNAAPGSVALNDRTTALSIALALKIQAGEALSLGDYIGALAVTPYVSVGAVSDADFNALQGLVADAIAQDRDPIQYTAYDTVNRRFANSWVGFSITDVTPRSGNINDTITITGSGFTSGEATVSVNGVAAAILTVSDDRITAQVSPGSRTGPVAVQIGTTLQAGPTFALNVNDGHRAYLNGKLYVSNPSWGTISEVAADGGVKTVLEGLSTPTQVTAGPDQMLYVACNGADKVLKVDPTTFAQSDFATVTKAYGLAFDTDGNLFVSSQDPGAGQVVELDATGTQQATYTGFTDPTSLGFDYAGRLYVVEQAGGITRLVPSGANGAPRLALATIVAPRGLAIDSGGYLYVASNDNSTVYRVDGTTGAVSVYTMINKPGGLCFDATGNLYVSDTEKNLIYRISPQGNLKIAAYGISNPRGLAIDPVDGTVFVSLNQSNAILEVNPTDGVLRPFVTGIANPLTLTFRGNGMYIGQPDIDTVSFVDRTGQMSTVVTGVESVSGADKATDGQVYLGRYGRPDPWQPNRDPIYDGGYAFLNPSGVLQPVRYPYVRNTHLRAIDATGNVYELSRSTNTLVAVLVNANGTKTVQRLATFGNQPSDVTYDASGNVYVSVQLDGKVYRFNQASSYSMTALAGFTSPYGLTISDAGVLYVTNKDGTLQKVGSPASATGADTGWSRTIPSALATPTQVTEVASMPGANALYLACGTKVLKYDLALDAFSDYLGYDMPVTLGHLYARSTGVLYVRGWQGQDLYTIATDKTYSVSQIGSYGGALDYDPSWNNYQSNSYGYQIYRNGGAYLGALGLTHEVAADGDLLYLASQGGRDTGLGGVFRYELTGASPKELYIPGAGTAVYSLAVNTNRDLYAGSSNNHVYRVDLAGTATDMWNLGTLPYGLDIRNDTLWAVGANCKLFEIPVAGAAATRTYGLMEPTY